MIDSRTGKQYQEDGGPAFGEFHQAGSVAVKTGGMTLRDYFAAKAMQGLQSVYWDTVDKYETAEDVLGCMAKSSYEIADAMIAERSKTKGDQQ